MTEQKKDAERLEELQISYFADFFDYHWFNYRSGYGGKGHGPKAIW